MKATFSLTEIDSLAPMPASVAQLAEIMSRSQASMTDIAKVIEFDEALTANILKLANSVWCRSKTQIQSVKDAVVRLGTAQILKMAVAGQIAGAMRLSCPGYELAEHELWRHSVAAALAAENMDAHVTVEVPKFAFTAALLHDVGKLLLNRHIEPEAVEELRDRMKRERITYLEAERSILGTDHSEVGGAIAQHWKFPGELVTAVACHHNPDQAPEPLMDVVHLANTVAKLIGVGLGSEAMHFFSSPETPKRLGMRARDLEALCAKVRHGLAKAEETYLGE